MTLRHCLAFALLISGGLVSATAHAQYNSRPNQPQQSPLAQANKAINDARTKLRLAQLEVQKVRDKEKTELMKKPEWAPIATELNKANADVNAAKRAAMNLAENKPEYQALLKDRDAADKVRQQADAPPTPGSDTPVVSDADLATANNTYISDSLKMKAIEKQVLTDDTKLSDANARLDAAKAKMAQLDAEVDEALKADQNYIQLQTAVAQAQQQVDQAEQQLQQQRQQLAQQAAQRAQQQSRSPNGTLGR